MGSSIKAKCKPMKKYKRAHGKTYEQAHEIPLWSRENDLLLFGSIVHWEKFLNFDTKYYDEFELIFPELSPAEIFQLKQQLKPA